MRYELQHEGWWEERPEMAAKVEGQVRALLVAARRRRLVPVKTEGLGLGEAAVYRLARNGVLYWERRPVEKGGQVYPTLHVDPREVAAYVALSKPKRRDVSRGWCPLEVMAGVVLAPRGDEEALVSRVQSGEGERWLPEGRLPAWVVEAV